MTDVPTVEGQRPSGAGAIDQVEQVEPVRRPPRPPAEPSGLERLIVPPDIGGPRIRVGVLWFFLLLAAVTAGRWWAAALCALVAAAAGYQMARSWAIVRAEAESDDGVAPIGAGRIPALLAGLLAAAVPVAAGYGTGLAGAALVVSATVAGLVSVLAGRVTGATVALASLPAGIAASSIVLALQVDLWVATFLVVAVSLYDAGSFLLGAEASGRWEGPVGGVVGVLAVTFTVATIKVPPFERAEWWFLGVLAATAMLGQWAATWCMAEPTASVPALRRLDAYLVTGPAVVAAAWLLTA